MDNEEDLYGDLPNFTTTDYIAKLETKAEALEKQVKQLETALANSECDKRSIRINSEQDKKNLLHCNENLLLNVSTLYKTARKEIERKDNTIRELQQQLDDLTFRRHPKSWPKNDNFQSLNEDNAIYAKPATDEKPTSSFIRSNSKSYDYNGRNKNSLDDKSPSLSRLPTKKYDYPDKDKYNDSTRIKCVESPILERKSKELNDFRYHNISSTSNRDEHYANKNLKRELDDRERRIRDDSKTKDRRYSPYEYRKDEHDRARPRLYKHISDEHVKHKTKRSSIDRNESRHETEDAYRNLKEDSRRQDAELIGRRSHEDRRKDEFSHSNRIVFDERRKDSESLSRKSVDDRKRENSTHRNVVDDRRQVTEPSHRKSKENVRKEEFFQSNRSANSFNDRRLYSEPVSRKSRDNVRKEEVVHSSRNENVFDHRRFDTEPVTRKYHEDRRRNEISYASRSAIDDGRSETEFFAESSTIIRKKEESLHPCRVTHDNSRQNLELFTRKFVEEHRREEPSRSCQSAIDDRLRIDVKNTSQKSSEESRRSFYKGISEERKSDDLNCSNRSSNDSRKDDELDNLIKQVNEKSKQLEELERQEEKRRYGSDDFEIVTNRENHIELKLSQPKVHRKRTKLFQKSPIEERVDVSESFGDNRPPIPRLPVQQESHSKKTESPLILSNTETNSAPVKKQVPRNKHSIATKSSHRKKMKKSLHDDVPTKPVDSQLENINRQTERSSSSPQSELCSKKAKLMSQSSSPPKIWTTSVDFRTEDSSQNVKCSPPELQELYQQHQQQLLRLSQNSPMSNEQSSKIMVQEILAQYGCFYATPLKVLNYDKYPFANFKLVSPIADTPDHVRALHNDTKIKISPIPMINERRILDGFNSPVKKPIGTIEQLIKSDDVKMDVKNSPNRIKKVEILPEHDNSSVVGCSQDVPKQLNSISTSPFKNCCIVKVKSDPVKKLNVEVTASVEQMTENSGIDSANVEHKVFTRRRRAPPVIRNLKKSDS